MRNKYKFSCINSSPIHRRPHCLESPLSLQLTGGLFHPSQSCVIGLKLPLQLLLDPMLSALSRLGRTILGRRGLLLRVVSGLLALILGLLATASSSDLKLIEDPLGRVLQLGEQRRAGRIGTVAEVGRLTTGHSLELLRLGALRDRDAVAVKVGLEIRLGPGVKGSVLGIISSLGHGRGHGRVSRAAGFGGAGVSKLSLLYEFLARSIRLGSSLLGSLVALSSEPFPVTVSTVQDL